MSAYSRRLFGPTLLSATSQTVYTCPVGKRAVVRNISAVNRDAATAVRAELRLGAVEAGTFFSRFIYYGESVHVETRVVLEAGETLTVRAGGATGTLLLYLTASGYELDA